MKRCVLDYLRPGELLPNGSPRVTLQHVFDIANDGDQIYFPYLDASLPYQAPLGGIRVTKSLEVFGDGPGLRGTDRGSTIHAPDDDGPVFQIVPPNGGITIRDLHLRRVGGGTGPAIAGQITSSGQLVSDLRLSGLLIEDFAADGIHIAGLDPGSNAFVGLSAVDVQVLGCGGAGIRLENVLDAYLLSVTLENNQKSGLVATACGVALYVCAFRSNSLAGGLGTNEGNLLLDSCSIASVDGCHFNDFDLSAIKKACVLLNCGGGSVRGGNFATGNSGSGAQGIVIAGAGSGPVAIVTNRFKDVPVMIEASQARDIVVFGIYDENGNGTLSLPTSPNNGLFGSPQVICGTGNNRITGLIVPSGSTNPNANLQPGMLAYNTSDQALRAYVDGFWKDVLVEDS